MSLATLQRRVATAIRQGDDLLDDVIIETTSVPRHVRLGIYADAYLLRLDEALRSNYPKLHLLLGDNDFLTLTRCYLDTQPSRQPNIRWFGDQLPTLLASQAPYADVPVFAELAQFEWALGLAFDAADSPTTGVTILGTLADDDWPNLRPIWHPGLRVMVFKWNTVAIWRALDADESPPPPQAVPSRWAVWREALQPCYRSLADDEAALLLSMQAGQTFGDACSALLSWHSAEEVPNRAVTLLSQWLQDGWIGIITSDS
ncbi:HvfC/BufC N-terminal domain-containing protein [Chitinimonas sp. PSY-7]|uniref:HvfC/BufC family peptide modification chaperone n=1 Tax=Chitinimonas sp. PSY-7 TaxID=3459088 RepID=UPI00403FF92D